MHFYEYEVLICRYSSVIERRFHSVKFSSTYIDTQKI